MTVAFDGSGSSDPDGDALAYAWDLDGDGAFDDATNATATYTYTQPGSYTATLRVTDPSAASGTSSVTISAGNTPPTAVIDTPGAGTTWKVGDVITFSGHATDAQSGTLAASALTWSLVLQHCPSTCHEHPLQTYAGTASGSFVAPDHEYPSHLDLRLTATDSGGLTNTTSRPARPADRRPHVRVDAAGADPGGRVDQPDDAVHPHRDRRLDALSQRALTAGQWWGRVRVRRVVGRRRPDAQHRGRRGACDLHRHLPGAAGRAGHLADGRAAG